MAKQPGASTSTFQLQKPAYSDVTRRILSVSDPTKIIVFGSHARGDDTKDSDLDITTPQQLARYRNVQGLIYQSAVNNGKVIYERPLTD